MVKKLHIAREEDIGRAKKLCEKNNVELLNIDVWGKWKTFLAGAYGVTLTVQGEYLAIHKLIDDFSKNNIDPQSVYYANG